MSWINDAEVTTLRDMLEVLATRKRTEIDRDRDTALQAGMPYTMPDGTQESVQTRAQDEPNLLGLAIEARDLEAEGVTDPVLTLRVESNRNYQLTPQQMIELTDASKNHKKLILAKSWQLKDAVDAALAAEDREAVDAILWGELPKEERAILASRGKALSHHSALVEQLNAVYDAHVSGLSDDDAISRADAARDAVRDIIPTLTDPEGYDVEIAFRAHLRRPS